MPDRAHPGTDGFPWRGLLALTAGAAAIRLAGIGLSGLWLDEAFEVTGASASLDRALLLETNHPPLHRLILALWVRVAGTSEIAVRMPAAVFGILTVPALFALADRVAGRRAGWLAAVLAAASPYLVFYSREARAYSLLVLLTALSCSAWLAWTRDDRPRGRLVWAAVAVAGLHTHYFFAFVLVAQAIDLLGRPDRGRRFREALFPAGAALALCLPWAIYTATHLAPQDRSYVQTPVANVLVTLFRFSIGYGLFVLDSTNVTLPPWEQARQAAPAAVLAALAFGPPLVLGIRAAWRRAESGGRLLVFLLLCPPVLLLPLSPVIPLLHDRYLAFAAPAFIALVAVGTFAMHRRATAVFAVLVVAVSLIGDATELLDPRCRKEQWREAAALVEAEGLPGDVVLLHRDHVHWAFEHYYRGGLPVLRQTSTPEAALRGRDPTRVWLVLSHVPWNEPPPAVLLDRLDRAGEEWVFPRHWGIRIVRYDAAVEDAR